VHPHPRDLGNNIVQALEVLDIECGVDVDSSVKEFLDVLPPLGVAGARDVRVGQLVRKDEGRVSFEGGV